ncbi:MAG: hypothetical protein CML81_08385 [Rhodobiaceae bacterium]|nr:hypothetical protein [Rhodobiaceae bacterium]RPF95368.1 MAG: hypothetical protein CBD87_008330 [Rhizobiales bacterium TMED227]
MEHHDHHQHNKTMSAPFPTQTQVNQIVDQTDEGRSSSRPFLSNIPPGVALALLGLGSSLSGRDPTRAVLGGVEILQEQKREREQKAILKELEKNPKYADQIKLIRGGVDPRMLDTMDSDLTADQKNYLLAVKQGYKGTFIDYLQQKKSPVVSIDQEVETEFQKEATKSAFRTLEDAQEQVQQFVDIEGRLNILQKQLQGGQLETGIFEELKIPFQRLAAGLNILPEDELKGLESKELFTRTVNYIVPRMRVAGSGSTSDTEVQLFRESAPSLQLEEGGNLLIVGGMSAVAKHNRERLKLMEKYIEDENLGAGDLIGFGEYADGVLGPVFKSYDSDQSFDQQVKEGKLKAGDFVYDGKYGEFRILTDEDVL